MYCCDCITEMRPILVFEPHLSLVPSSTWTQSESCSSGWYHTVRRCRLSCTICYYKMWWLRNISCTGVIKLREWFHSFNTIKYNTIIFSIADCHMKRHGMDRHQFRLLRVLFRVICLRCWLLLPQITLYKYKYSLKYLWHLHFTTTHINNTIAPLQNLNLNQEQDG